MLVIPRVLFTYLFIFFSLFIFLQRILETFAKRKTIKGFIKERWTFLAMLVVHLFIFFGAIFEYFRFPRPINLITTVLGFNLYFFGLVLRNYAIRTLKEYWSIHIEIRDEHKFIYDGPYKYIRHPAYLAILCEITGITLVPNAYLTFLISFPIYLFIILLRIQLEETELVKKFGQEYSRYKKEVGVLLPLKFKK